MATIRKRGHRWQAIVKRGQQQHSRTFDTKAQAANWAKRTEQVLDGGQDRTKTLRHAIERYRDTISAGKRGARWERLRLDKMLAEWPEVDLALVDIRAADVAEWRDRRIAATSASTARRELNLLSHVFAIAVKEWGWIATSPTAGVRRPKEPEHRERVFTDDEIERVLLACGWDRYEPASTPRAQVAVAFLLAIETAMRAGEIVGLQPHHVDLDRRVAHLPQTKGGVRRDVPLSSEAVKLIQCLPGDLFGITPGYLSSTFNNRIRHACGIRDATFHDTRHTAITRLAGRLEVMDLARMTGHRDLKMLMRYYNPDPAQLARRLG